MSAIQSSIREAFARAGVSGRLHAVDIDRGDVAQVAVRADDPVPIASVSKLPLAAAFFRAAQTGRLDPTAPVTLSPGTRSSGPTGVGAMLDPVTMSLRDLAFSAISVSDNAAADALIEVVGLDAVNGLLDELGLTGTRVVQRVGELFAGMAEDAGGSDPALLADPAVLARLRALDPARTNRSTPREMTRLLASIWRDEAVGPEYGAQLRRLLGLQVWPHRLASGFPFDDVRVSGKTGTLPTVRNEVGVVEYPDGGRYAVAVFTVSQSTAFSLPAADAVIGTAAKLAVDHLRSHQRTAI